MLMALLVQFGSGLLLTFYFTPTVADACSSVALAMRFYQNGLSSRGKHASAGFPFSRAAVGLRFDWCVSGAGGIAAMAHLLISWFILPALEAAVMPRNNVA